MQILPFGVSLIINPETRLPQDIRKIIYEDDFFICIYDKLHKDKDNFHYTVWCKEDIRSLLDLERKHIPKIQKMKNIIMHKFNLSNENSEIFIHFPPSYWRLHIHFVARPHIFLHRHELYSIDDIINNLTRNNDYYRTAVVIGQSKM